MQGGSSPPSPERGARRHSIDRRIFVAAALPFLAVLAFTGEFAFHHFWPFQPFRDEMARVGAPLPGASITTETTAGFPYGCLDECPSVTATWHLTSRVTLGQASRLVASRLSQYGYHLGTSRFLRCWVLASPGQGPSLANCPYYFNNPRFNYTVIFTVAAPKASFPPDPGRAETPVAVAPSVAIAGMDTVVSGR